MRAKQSTQVDELTARQHRAIVALLQNITVTGAAQTASVSEATLYRWLAVPAFKDEFRRQRRMMFERAVGLAQRASAAAVGEVINIMRDGENEFARLAAARVILDLARASDVEERLEVLEEQLSTGEGEESLTALKEGVVSLQSRLKSLEQRVNERAERKSEEACMCGYVETMDGEEPMEETARTVAANLLCFERNHKRAAHVGFNTVIVGRIETGEDEGGSPLVA
jgi:hypothetical protein